MSPVLGTLKISLVCVCHVLRDLELLFVLEFPVCGFCTERLRVFIIFSVLGDFEFENKFPCVGPVLKDFEIFLNFPLYWGLCQIS